jgi:hypothetical protein
MMGRRSTNCASAGSLSFKSPSDCILVMV